MALRDSRRPFDAKDKPIGVAFEEAGSSQPQVLPVYQRRFSWGKSEIDTFISDGEDLSARQDRRNPPHNFVGAMVFSVDANTGARSIIDGQQRLTVLLLMFLAAGVRLKDKSYVERAITSEPYRSLLIKPDVKDFRQCAAVIDHVNESFPELNILTFSREASFRGGQCFRAYHNILERFTAMDPRRVRKVVQTILERFVVASIVVKDPLWGAQVFSSLNDSGVRLRDADLIRIYMYTRFSSSRSGAKQAEEFMESKWEQFEDRLDSDPKLLDDFYYHFAASCVDTSVTRGTLLNDLRDYWNGSNKRRKQSPEQIVDELNEWLDAYELVVGRVAPESRGSNTVYVEALRRLQVVPGANTYWTYAIQLIHAVDAKKATKAKAAKCLRTLESFVVRKAIVDSQLAGLRKTLITLFSTAGDSDREVRKRLARLSDDLRGPDNKQLEAFIVGLKGNFHNRLGSYILTVRERTLRVRNPKSPMRSDLVVDGEIGVGSFAAFDGLTRDHMSPQNPLGDFELPDSGVVSGYEYSEIVHSLGNLTLLEPRLNKARGNRSGKMMATCYEESSVKDPKRLAPSIRKRHGHPWPVREMKRRAKTLSNFVIEHDEGWPQPW